MFRSLRLAFSGFFCFALLSPALAAELDVTGVWTGKYEYPGTGQPPVEFTVTIIQDGDELSGHIKEVNTFGQQPEPFLHSALKGRLDKKTRGLTFTKTYDGTAGAVHAVEYSGRISDDGGTVDAGSWKLGGLEGSFLLAKVEGTQAGPLAGFFKGTYHYPEKSGKKPVEFTLLLVHEGSGVTGECREENTPSVRIGPWLHADISGSYDKDERKLHFTKSYDGTAGIDREDEYVGWLSAEGNTVEGKWKMGDDEGGRFTFKKVVAEKPDAEKDVK